MKFYSQRCWLAAILILGSPSVAQAEINAATSVEWLACSAEMIVIGKISKINTTRGPGEVTYEDCVVDLNQVIKGARDIKQISFTLRRIGDRPTAQPLLNSAEGLLLFLSKSKNHGPEHHLVDKWVPTTRHGTPLILDLTKPLERVYSKDMKLIDDKKDLLKLVGLWASSPVNQSLRWEIPPDSPIFSQLWAGSTCYFIVPAEEKYRAHFMQLAHSATPHERAKAASELWKFPGQSTEAVLRQLLKDDAELVGHYSQDQIARVEYHVRAAAYHSLQLLGKPVPEMALERKPTAEEQQKLREKCWRESFAAALKGGWSVSVDNGPSRVFEGREYAIVIVTCQRKEQQAKFTLIPKQWPMDKLVENEYLGTNGLQSQGARRFYLQSALPEDIKKQVVAYFGLER